MWRIVGRSLQTKSHIAKYDDGFEQFGAIKQQSPLTNPWHGGWVQAAEYQFVSSSVAEVGTTTAKRLKVGAQLC